MEDNKVVEPSAPAGGGAEKPEPGNRGVFGTRLPLGVALVLVVVLPVIGFAVGIIGIGKESSTSTVNATIGPNNAGGALEPGRTVRVTVLVENPNDYGVQVVSISEGSSQEVDTCAAGVVTSDEVEAPAGYIRPHGVRGYSVTATMAANAPESCVDQTFTLPLTVDLESAAG